MGIQVQSTGEGPYAVLEGFFEEVISKLRPEEKRGLLENEWRMHSQWRHWPFGNLRTDPWLECDQHVGAGRRHLALARVSFGT